MCECDSMLQGCRGVCNPTMHDSQQCMSDQRLFSPEYQAINSNKTSDGKHFDKQPDQ